MEIMRTRVMAAALAALALLWPQAAGAPQAGGAAVFESPLLITSAGQSPDVQLAVVLAKRAGVEHTLAKLAASGRFEVAEETRDHLTCRKRKAPASTGG